jgi:ribonuclease HI
MQPQYRNFIMQQPKCTYLHGWFVETAEDKTFRQTLLSIPDTSGQFEHISNVPEVLHCFTDGSGHSPNQKTLRLVTWSVCVATFADHEFEPLAAGGLPGLLQTVLRGELTAAISACKAALAFNKPFYIWTDCQVVFDRIQQYAERHSTQPSPKQKDRDLWSNLFSLMQVCCHKNLFQKVLKVTSHQEETQFSHLVDAWAARGNDAADETAAEAFELLPQAVLVAHVKLKHKTALRYAACRALHTMFVDIGKRVVAEK